MDDPHLHLGNEIYVIILEAYPYDVLLTDISMPGLSGLELLGHVRQKFPMTPVIIIFGIGDQEHAQGLIKLGAFDFLLKPFSLEVVEKSVNRALEYRRRLLESPSSNEQDAEDDPRNRKRWIGR